MLIFYMSLSILIYFVLVYQPTKIGQTRYPIEYLSLKNNINLNNSSQVYTSSPMGQPEIFKPGEVGFGDIQKLAEKSTFESRSTKSTPSHIKQSARSKLARIPFAKIVISGNKSK